MNFLIEVSLIKMVHDKKNCYFIQEVSKIIIGLQHQTHIEVASSSKHFHKHHVTQMVDFFFENCYKGMRNISRRVKNALQN